MDGPMDGLLERWRDEVNEDIIMRWKDDAMKA